MRPVPAGDILVHGGDFSTTGQYEEVKAFLDWIKQQPHRLKVFIAGNHDVTLDNNTGFYDTNWERQAYPCSELIQLENLHCLQHCMPHHVCLQQLLDIMSQLPCCWC